MIAFAPTIEREAHSWAALLASCYERAGLSLPHLVRLDARQVPQPYRQLLAHSSDMTPTLERFHECTLSLRVLARERFRSTYEREVVLCGAEDSQPVEYGAIRIFLDHFPESAQRKILQERAPLGGILAEESIPHLGWPQAFFRLDADFHISRVLSLNEPCRLYGRRNVLLDGSRRMLADVFEVLAPAGSRHPHKTQSCKTSFHPL